MVGGEVLTEWLWKGLDSTNFVTCLNTCVFLLTLEILANSLYEDLIFRLEKWFEVLVCFGRKDGPGRDETFPQGLRSQNFKQFAFRNMLSLHSRIFQKESLPLTHWLLKPNLFFFGFTSILKILAFMLKILILQKLHSKSEFFADLNRSLLFRSLRFFFFSLIC